MNQDKEYTEKENKSWSGKASSAIKEHYILEGLKGMVKEIARQIFTK